MLCERQDGNVTSDYGHFVPVRRRERDCLAVVAPRWRVLGTGDSVGRPSKTGYEVQACLPFAVGIHHDETDRTAFAAKGDADGVTRASGNVAYEMGYGMLCDCLPFAPSSAIVRPYPNTVSINVVIIDGDLRYERPVAYD